MNAFRRSHAIKGLEELSLVICIHFVLVASFPEHDANKHWQGELDGFLKTLKRWGRGKGNKQNLTYELVWDTLSETLHDTDEQELIEASIDAKTLRTDKLAWREAIELALEFARKF